jgi:23S rRNA (uracil1939-C5)-methyltransferase
LTFNGGRGVGRYEGVVVFVPWAAPGDRVLVRVTENKKTFLVAELVKVLEPSPARVQPSCPVFTRCGGCTWQHVAYSEQIAQKKRILEAAMKKWDGRFEWREFLPSPEVYRYRNRIQLNKRGSAVGYFARRSREIVPISDCPIAEIDVAAQIPHLQQQPDGRYEISRRLDGHVEVEEGRRNPEAALFSQVNTRQNERLIATVTEWVRELSVKNIWDLYCGSGNLTIPLAKSFPDLSVTGVELSADAIRLAQKNKPEDETSVRWVAQDVAAFLREQNSSENLLIVLDPPRVGVDESVIQHMGRLQPEFVIYVSCDPMTFARDAIRLKTWGYELDRMQGFDMFPQTEHVELMSLFRRVISS